MSARGLLLAMLMLWPGAATAATSRPPVYALVLGVDDYTSLPKLQGAVNDADGIAKALRQAGAREVVTLLNSAATRERVLAAFRDLAAKAERENGWLVMTYAGHGGQEPERLAGDEQDGRDEVLLLGGFGTRGAANAERITDNEIYGLLSTVSPRVKVVLVTDACHSGTMSRGVDKRSGVGATRLATYGPILEDALPPPPPMTRRKEGQDLPNVVFIASALDSEVTPEVAIEGKAHGAVSWHFAKALTGAADLDGDGATSLAELRQYVVIQARLTAESRQTPSVQFLAGRATEPFGPAVQGAVSMASTEPARPGVWVLGGRPLPAIPGAVAAASRQSSDLIWDPQARQVISNATSDLIAEQGPAQADAAFLAGVVDKWRALPTVKRLVAAAPLPVQIGPNGAGARYVSGAVTVSPGPLPSPSLGFLTILNLAGDGTVQLLYPPAGRSGEVASREAALPAFPTTVQPPYGADHLIVIATAAAPTALRAGLEGLNGQQASLEAAEVIRRELSRQAHAIGVAAVFTAGAP